MTNLDDVGPTLDEHRLARRRRHLMTELTTTPDARPAAARPRPRPGRRTLVIAGVAVAAAGLAGAAIAITHHDGPAIWRQADGSVAIDGQALRDVYQGRYVTPDEVTRLQADGKAMAGVVNRELACQGITLLFDTDAEVQAYQDGFTARHGHEPTSLPEGTDPCAAYADSPRFVTEAP